MPVQPNFLERAAFYTLNQAPGVMLDMAGALSYQALSTAVRLGVFDTLAGQSLSAAELATALDAEERGVASLLLALEAIGYVESNNGRFANSTMTRKWLLESEAFNGKAILSFWDDLNVHIWPNADEVIRTGQRPTPVYDWIESDPKRNRSFQQTLVVTALGAGEDIAHKMALPPTASRVLDVAGGHGLFSILLCQQHPNLRATIIERPAALAIAADYVAEYGMEDRIELVAGDLWDVEWGQGYDVVLLFNLLHHFDPVTNAKLLRKSVSSLKSGGCVAILDQIAGKVNGAATNAFIRLMALQYYVMADGRVFTEQELEHLLAHTGFANCHTHALFNLPGTSLMMATKA